MTAGKIEREYVLLNMKELDRLSTLLFSSNNQLEIINSELKKAKTKEYRKTLIIIKKILNGKV